MFFTNPEQGQKYSEFINYRFKFCLNFCHSYGLLNQNHYSAINRHLKEFATSGMKNIQTVLRKIFNYKMDRSIRKEARSNSSKKKTGKNMMNYTQLYWTVMTIILTIITIHGKIFIIIYNYLIRSFHWSFSRVNICAKTSLFVNIDYYRIQANWKFSLKLMNVLTIITHIFADDFNESLDYYDPNDYCHWRHSNILYTHVISAFSKLNN